MMKYATVKDKHYENQVPAKKTVCGEVLTRNPIFTDCKNLMSAYGQGLEAGKQIILWGAELKVSCLVFFFFLVFEFCYCYA